MNFDWLRYFDLGCYEKFDLELCLQLFEKSGIDVGSTVMRKDARV